MSYTIKQLIELKTVVNEILQLKSISEVNVAITNMFNDHTYCEMVVGGEVKNVDINGLDGNAQYEAVQFTMIAAIKKIDVKLEHLYNAEERTGRNDNWKFVRWFFWYTLLAGIINGIYTIINDYIIINC